MTGKEDRIFPRPGGVELSNFDWMNTLSGFALMSGGLVGFTLAFIPLILGLSVGNTKLYAGITWGNIGILLNGISAVLFVAAAEFFTTATEYNVWALPTGYEKHLSDLYKQHWEAIKQERLKICFRYEELGRYSYNFAIFLMFLALFFVIGSYNPVIALIVAALGVGLEFYQMVLAKEVRPKNPEWQKKMEATWKPS